MGEIRTVKGRERERATAVEQVVVTPQRQKLLGKSMPRQPHNWRGMCASGAFEAQHVRLPDQRSQQLLSEQHECSQTAGNGIPLRGASEFSGVRQIVPCVTAQLAMQGLGSHTRTRVTKTSHIAV